MISTVSLMLACSVPPPDWTPSRLIEALRKPETLAAKSTHDELVQWFGGVERLQKGVQWKVEDLAGAWAYLAPKGTTRVWLSADHDALRAEMVRLGNSGLFVGARDFEEGFSSEFQLKVESAGSDLGTVGDARRLEFYTVPPEAKPHQAARQGRLEQQPRLTSQIFGGTGHDWWIYLPPDFDPGQESNLVVFQDGQWAHAYAPVYFDNMCRSGDLPQTIVVFVTPGTFPDGKSDRSREYDTLNDDYSRFLLEELLPPVEAKYKITQDPMKRCVAGLSSGGICAFTVAWNRPDRFGLVMSWIGSFTNIASGDSKREGGHNYPALIRKSDKKPIRVFLQDGENDLDNVHGNWFLANKEMARALEFKGYPMKAVWGRGGHTDLQGRATMPEALRWLFQSRG